jgi:hypothetical protein
VKKLMVGFIMTVLVPAAFIAGCTREMAIPASPVVLAGLSATPTKSSTPTGTPTASPTITSTPMATATPQTGQLPVNLNSAASFVVLAYTQITNSGPTTLCGDLGLSPGTSVSGAPVLSCGGIMHVTDTAAAQAQLDLTTAYNDAAGRTTPALVAGNIGGQTLYPGLYKSTGGLAVSSGDLTLDAQGNVNGVFIFQIASTLVLTPGRQVILAGGAKATNVYWQVGSYCSLDTTVSMVGTIMAHNQITLNTGAVLDGRALSQIDEVTLLSNTITKPAP